LDWLHKRYKSRTLFSGNPKGGNPKPAPGKPDTVTPAADAGQPVPPKTLPGQTQPAKNPGKYTDEERREIQAKIKEIKARGTVGKTADSRPQTAAEILPPVDPKALHSGALEKLRTARGGGASLRIEKGNDDALTQLAKDIANVSETYGDSEQQFKVAEALARKAAQQNTKGSPPQKLDEFFDDLYGRVIDIKKK
jgi:hypothetical protein